MIKFIDLILVVVVVIEGNILAYRVIQNNNKKEQIWQAKNHNLKTENISLAHLGQAENELKELKPCSSSPGLGGTKVTNH